MKKHLKSSDGKRDSLDRKVKTYKNELEKTRNKSMPDRNRDGNKNIPDKNSGAKNNFRDKNKKYSDRNRNNGPKTSVPNSTNQGNSSAVNPSPAKPAENIVKTDNSTLETNKTVNSSTTPGQIKPEEVKEFGRPTTIRRRTLIED